MAIVSMRQLLDHAAENGYGIPAFNVNNLEQVQAVMTRCRRSRRAGDPAGQRRRAQVRRRAVHQAPDPGRDREPTRRCPLVMHQDHGQSPDVCQGAIDLGFSSVMMDGSLQADGKTIASYDYNVDVTRKVVDMAHELGVTVEGELGCLGSLETMKGDKEDGHGTEAHDDARAAAHRPRAGRRLRQAHAARRAGDRHRHQPRRLQVHPQAHRRHPRHRAASRRSTAASRTRTW